MLVDRRDCIKSVFRHESSKENDQKSPTMYLKFHGKKHDENLLLLRVFQTNVNGETDDVINSTNASLVLRYEVRTLKFCVFPRFNFGSANGTRALRFTSMCHATKKKSDLHFRLEFLAA
jgi:hypothetical protein